MDHCVFSVHKYDITFLCGSSNMHIRLTPVALYIVAVFVVFSNANIMNVYPGCKSCDVNHDDVIFELMT